MSARQPLYSNPQAILATALIMFVTLLPGSAMATAATAAAAEDGGSPGRGLEAGWDRGITWRSPTGRLMLRFGGRLLVDAGWFDEDQGTRDAVNGGLPLESGVDFRRARLCLSGSYTGRLIFKADYDFVTIVKDYRNFRDLYIGVRDLPVAGTLRFGNVKEPMGLEQQASTNHVIFTERSLASFLLPLRNRGIVNQAGMLNGRMSWATGLYRDVDGYNLGKGSGITVSGRLTALPWRPADDRLLHLGLAGSVRDLDHCRIAAPPESAQTPIFVDTGRFEADGTLITNLESALVLGPLSLQGEFIRSAVDSAEAGDPVFHGGYVQLSWFITGEHRSYDPAAGKFVQTALKGNVFKGDGPGGLAAGRTILGPRSRRRRGARRPANRRHGGPQLAPQLPLPADAGRHPCPPCRHGQRPDRHHPHPDRLLIPDPDDSLHLRPRTTALLRTKGQNIRAKNTVRGPPGVKLTLAEYCPSPILLSYRFDR